MKPERAEAEEKGDLSKTPPRPWTAAEIESFTKEIGVVVERLGEKYIAFMREKWQHDGAIENATSKAGWRVLAILMGFLAIVIIIVSVLVAIGKASGDSLLFVIGTVTGYIFALVQRHLFPETVEVTPPG